MENNIKKRQECCSRNSSTSATRHSPISKHSPVSKHLPASKQNSSSYQDNNINDVCFDCDGGCSDATCSRNAHHRILESDLMEGRSYKNIRGYNTLGNLETNCFQSGIEKRNESPEKTNAPKKFRNTKHSEDSCSEEVGDVSEDDESSSHPPCRQSLSTLSSEGVLSEEDMTSDRSGHQDGSGDNGFLSMGSAENLQAELTKFTNIPDGLSDREKTQEDEE
ncbi:mitogen-activated protein kinase kinase kinase 13 [Biomphalaria glabrata]|nr:mitogen-activated protein kinase kinase kinase 13 [Biomphalaria glabrata]